jgi:hypothetical protein
MAVALRPPREIPIEHVVYLPAENAPAVAEARPALPDQPVPATAGDETDRERLEAVLLHERVLREGVDGLPPETLVWNRATPRPATDRDDSVLSDVYPFLRP